MSIFKAMEFLLISLGSGKNNHRNDWVIKTIKIKLAIICHASNVTGTAQDINTIMKICKKYNTKLSISI